MKTKSLSDELKEFVKYQAAEDAVLSVKERKYQAQLVTDVLTQEAPNARVLKELLTLYRTSNQPA
jgi:hypothetical protein